MNMQDLSDECTKKFLKKAEEKIGDSSLVPSNAITRYCRMLTVYCDAEGKVTENFIRSMDKCIQEITSVEGMEEVLNECNKCPDDV
jgi:hypothetical protein